LRCNKWLYLQVPFFWLFHGLSLLRLARKTKPDLIYAHWFTPQAINAAIVSLLLGIPFIFTTHAADVSVLKRLPFSGKLVKWVCRKSFAYTAVSERTAKKLAGFFSDDEWQEPYARKLKIIPMGIACPPANSHNPEPTGEHATGVQQILFIGRLVEKKGVDRLIRAIAEIHAREKEPVHLIVAGEGPERKNLEELSRTLGISERVEFIGHISGNEKNNLYEQAGMVCIPSIITADGDSEGFPLVLMEALYYGKIVIASDLSGAETLLDNRTNGFVFESDSSDGLERRFSRS
jgi:glycosyltransferase involved in cell wall biosynthesis